MSGAIFRSLVGLIGVALLGYGIWSVQGLGPQHHNVAAIGCGLISLGNAVLGDLARVRLILASSLIGLLLLTVAWCASNAKVKCLDDGGRWNRESKRCEGCRSCPPDVERTVDP